MITIKNAAAQDGIRRSAELLTRVFARIGEIIEPGMSTRDIDREVETLIKSAGGYPAFLGYKGFPASLCASVNDGVIHGIPNTVLLAEGDIVGCDVGVELNGCYSDSAKTYTVGRVSSDIHALLRATRESLDAAVAVCVPGGRIKDIGKAVTQSIAPHGYGIVTGYCGHGVGFSIHEDPQIPNHYPSRGRNPRLRSGMVLAVEPMINAGDPAVKVLEDEWSVVTMDGSLSAHFEHSVLITPSGPEILTSWGES